MLEPGMRESVSAWGYFRRGGGSDGYGNSRESASLSARERRHAASARPSLSVRRVVPRDRRRDRCPGGYAWSPPSTALAVAALSLTSGWSGPASPAAHPAR